MFTLNHELDLIKNRDGEFHFHMSKKEAQAHYTITKEQLEYLGKCVRKLKRLTKKICKEKIESFIG